MHEYAGTVQEYIMHPSFMGFRLRMDNSRVDMQTWLLGMLLFSITALPMPQLLDDFTDCYTDRQEQKRWNSAKNRLMKLADQIDTDNSARLYPFMSFNPSVLEC